MINAKDYIPVREIIPDKIKKYSLLNILTNGVTVYTHGFHKYPAKFIPHIPRWAINKYLAKEKKGTVLDPFCGSGTTLVEGMIGGHNVIGLDIDPLSCLITKVKTTTVDVPQLDRILNWLVKQIKTKNKVEFELECTTIGHWFSQETINKLSIIRTIINEIPEKFGNAKNIRDIQDLLIVCFSSIIRRVSNADNESQKTYVSHTHIKTPEEPITLFFSQLDLFRKRIVEFSENIMPKLGNSIICTSSTESLKAKLEGRSIDLAITSPPYIKAIDYIYNQMVELFWIGDLFSMQTQPKQNEKKKEYIGTKHFYKTEFVKYNPFDITIGIKELDNRIQKVFRTDMKNGHKHAYVAFRYFTDMKNHFSEISKCLNKGRHYIMVVGDSSISDIFFNTSDFLIELAKRNGFRMINKWGYKIKNRYMRFDRNGRGGIIEIDWVIDLVRK